MYDERILATSRTQYAEYERAVAAGWPIHSPADDVCRFHRHGDDIEVLKCHENQKRLGLPVTACAAEGQYESMVD